jgi:hypothetical protein
MLMVSLLVVPQLLPGVLASSDADDAGLNAAVSVQGKEIKRTLDFESGGSLRINLDVSEIRMSSWDRNQVDVSARIEPPRNANEEYARRIVEATELDISGDARSLTIRSVIRDSFWKGLSDHWRGLPTIHCEIRAPRTLNLRLDIDRSTLDLNGFEGDLSLKTDRSSLTASDLIGTIRVRVDRAEEFTLTRLQGTLDVDGDRSVLKASGLTGPLRLKLDRGGRSVVSGLRGSFDIESDRTNISLQAIQINGDSRLDVHRGDIGLRLPESQGLMLDAEIGRREDFESDFAITMRTFRNDRIEGTINGGGPRLTINTERAKVTLRRWQ